ncbi:adenylyltransferase/cytidyltransferase family protein [Planctobacterium marinum]|uniref:Glycerol-3-phosphate cytidylyltransferase n=1 Tax=Planctobacterium marinum TaxID=1631968 RepID=A0AA48HDX1_9ALTE|nr:glycerol-3-phosphate cytidylyltransferase [Planctobacterium marinum]
MRRVITFGTYDVFHVGHVKLLKRAKACGDHLTVGVSSDELNFSKKGRNPVYSLESRMEIISSLKFVDDVFVEHSLEAKEQYILQAKADVLVMGDDWQGRFDHFKSVCEVVYLPRTPSVSTTELIEVIKETR